MSDDIWFLAVQNVKARYSDTAMESIAAIVHGQSVCDEIIAEYTRLKACKPFTNELAEKIAEEIACEFEVDSGYVKELILRVRDGEEKGERDGA